MNDLTKIMIEIARTPLEVIMLPKFINPAMKLEDAARQAHMRGMTLKASWDPTLGLRVKAVKREKDESQRT